jgi:hypothetical protein
MAGTKTDNHNAPAKLALRRHLLRAHHAGTAAGISPIRVLDCCQATGLLWRELRKEFAVESYWGVDLVPKKGRLKIDSVRILDQPGWSETVVDIDTYGSPWKHWFALLRNCRHDVTVFLTIGSKGSMPRNIGAEEKTAIGLTLDSLPFTLGQKIAKITLPYCLAAARAHGFELIECIEADNTGGTARYIGVRLARCVV